ncbi:hypothetical protein B0T16DRAFT_391910 [Cercophora newfieldiana]|uniref:Uncharacterized protein n=1 Tax=Cercophora newfieldiana TaxID=92897 RepID=A0AA39XZX2_9PEZI|nr:hypothetical protein B0T16DRAFT_391910 [Cercophora newfieldiana]
MGKRSEKPIIRILILGAPGVGKGCLESTFTTTTYPPLYDASLTINSRRFLTLAPRPQPEDPSAADHPLASTSRRPRSASTTISNPASEHRTSSALDETDKPLPSDQTSTPPKLTLQTNQPPSTPLWPSASTTTTTTTTTAPLTPTTPTSSSSPTTYLIEVTNYPALQHPKTRASLLAKGDYDAVLLVYDITSRASFSAIPALHAEIPLIPNKKHRRRRASLRRSRSSFFYSSSPASTAHQRKGSGSTHDDIFPSRERETVVALVGNKCDVDAGEIDLGYPLLEKEAVLQAADVEERSLVHPLFRQSVLEVDGGEDTASLGPLSPPLKSPRSVRSVPVARRARMDGEDGARRARSVVEDGTGVRTSVFSVAKRGSLRLDGVPEDRRVEEEVARSRVPVQRRRKGGGEMPPTPPEEEATSAIQKWFLELEGESQAADEHREEAEMAVPTREVSRFEGEMLARTLLLNVPFRETSAKTGENVDEIFEAIVREVLWEMGKEVEASPLEHSPEEKAVKGQREKVTPTLGRKRSVLKKDRRGDAKEPVRESLTSDLPPTLTLPGLEEEHNESKNNEAKTLVSETLEHVAETEPETTTLQPPEVVPRRRRESALENFFKRVFTKKSATVVPDVAV